MEGIEGLLKFEYANPDATGVAHDSIDELLATNKAQNAFDIGSIGPTPYQETDEFQQKAFDIAQGLAIPGAAIGRIAKGAITGGHRMLGKIPKHIQNLLDTPGSPFVVSPFAGGGKELLKKGTKEGDRVGKELLGLMKEDNKINRARILMEKALNKWGGIKHSQTVNDPITENLRALKYRQN